MARRLSLLLALGALGTAATATAAEPAAAKPAATPTAAPGAAAAAPKSTGAKRKSHLRACPAHMPAELNPPPDATLELVLPANGVQSYGCAIDKPGEAPDWQPKGPHAMLGEGTNVVGIHFGGPSWQGLDGSTVKGTKIASAPSPDKSAVTWLLLSGVATGQGTFGKITHIQRLETVGGRPPSGGCDASHLDTRVLVPYRSYYYFYRLSEPGEKVQQCRSVPEKHK
ncbi:MAG: DUF3455 domain-containing protein [Deltaproteobacteria bacterium]